MKNKWFLREKVEIGVLIKASIYLSSWFLDWEKKKAKTINCHKQMKFCMLGEFSKGLQKP